MRRICVLLFLAVIVAGCLPSRAPTPDLRNDAGPAPSPMREFRGVWIATVANIDWPPRPGMSSEEQQAELRSLFDRVALLNMNAVVLQVRPAADAFYVSDLEPWSEYLTGSMGVPPYPMYDPLAFAVEEAHRRGLELHAWFNPFRAGHRTRAGTASENHISRRRPDLVVEYGDQLWLDPGQPDARAHSLAVILDVVQRYDIDGVHMDDYFYPYPIEDGGGVEVPFPDSASWARAAQPGAHRSRSDWRRSNIDRFVEQLYRDVKQWKPWVKVGLSPFGIWRPGHPPEVRGFDAYDRLYADARLWLQQGWVDYLSPQLYWSIESEGQSYPKLFDWWRSQNTLNRHLWPGNSIYRIESHDWPVEQILEQIRITRRAGSTSGNVLFSMRILDRNAKGLSERLLDEVYRAPALVPEMPWSNMSRPSEPIFSFRRFGGHALFTFQPAPGDEAWRWILRIRRGDSWELVVLPGWQQQFRVTEGYPAEAVLSVVNRSGAESRSVGIKPARSGALPTGF